ncbi:MAG: hypothetical protein P1T08_06730 [Acidimicrobiia bacterium]|nr:hypothetical protein [Acidimicrobiia bacterium]
MTNWKRLWRPLSAGAVILVMAFFPFVRSTRVPLLGNVDLGFHELGHLIGYLIPISERLTAALGSITQIAVPLGLATYFLWWRTDRVAGGLMLAWAGTSAWDASVYIADAPYERLQLIGGDHDWAFLLGPTEFNNYAVADELAAFVEFVGGLSLITGLIICLAVPIRGWLDNRRAEEFAEHTSTLPVREPKWHGESPDGPSGNTLPG